MKFWIVFALLIAVVSCNSKRARALPEWVLSPENISTRSFGIGVSFPVSDTATATLQARTMAATVLAFSKEVRVSSYQSLAEDAAGASVNEANSRFLSSMPAELPPISKIARLANGVTIVEVSTAEPAVDASTALELSWFEKEAQELEELSIGLTAGETQWNWSRAGGIPQFIPEQVFIKKTGTLKETDWQEKSVHVDGFESATGECVFGSTPGDFTLAFLSAYAHALTHLSHAIKSEMTGSQQMFSKNRAGAAVKNVSNTIIPGIRILGMSILATADGRYKLEMTVGAPKETLNNGI